MLHLTKRGQIAMQEIKNVLESCEFFRGLEQGIIDKIAELCQMETYEPGRYVFHQGDFGEQLFVIAEGHVFLERSMDLGKGSGNVVIGILGKGRVFGCWSTLLGEPHKLLSSATCQKPTKIVTIKGSDLRNMMLDNAELGFKILERLCFLLRDRIEGVYGAMEKI
jgi:CRP/FNR family cyclic AMP-dependent transcriptional regulator